MLVGVWASTSSVDKLSQAAQGGRDFGGGEISVTPIFCQAK